MKTPLKTRLAALLASVLVTFATVYTVADYAYPESPAAHFAAAPR